ncbi:MAG: hypothetical protein OXL68_13160 [Paracoccaceae bacterium]|nr:hypothetical protein [Paracoccaceae bacterium]
MPRPEGGQFRIRATSVRIARFTSWQAVSGGRSGWVRPSRARSDTPGDHGVDGDRPLQTRSWLVGAGFDLAA